MGTSEQQGKSNQSKIIPGEYPGAAQAHIETAKNYSSAGLIGPPLCDELIELVRHMFTEEEASIVQHLKPFRIKTAEAVARAEHRPADEVSRILDRLADEKSVIASFSFYGKKRYFIMPIVPGTFEWVMIHPSENDLNDWHRGFAERFNALYNTGYHADYFRKFGESGGLSPIRYIPVTQSIVSHPMALPTDKLEEILDMYDDFGVGICQCRATKRITGDDCGRPLEVCASFGPFVDALVKKGKVRRVEKKELIEIKAKAEAAGLITWMMNVDEKTAKIGNCSCSCCGCCCPMLGTMTKYNIPGLIAPPHFMPVFDKDKCVFCGKCVENCQMDAIIMDAGAKTITHFPKRCIGCGQCTLACDKQRAITMEPVPEYGDIPGSFASMGVRVIPSFMRMMWHVWRSRRKNYPSG